jgi:hypothetical protein
MDRSTTFLASNSFKRWFKRHMERRLIVPLGKKDLLGRLTRSLAFPGTDREGVWTEDWENDLMREVIDRVRVKADPKQYQLFQVHTFGAWPLLRIIRFFQANPTEVYLARCRIRSLIKAELDDLRSKILDSLSSSSVECALVGKANTI